MSNKTQNGFHLQSHLNNVTNSLFFSGRVIHLPVSIANGYVHEQYCAHRVLTFSGILAHKRLRTVVVFHDIICL